MGVPNIWLIDPYKRLAYTFTADGLQPTDPASLTIPNTPIRIDLTALFAKLNENFNLPQEALWKSQPVQ